MKMNTKVATIISRICDPFVMMTVVFMELFWGSAVFLPAFIFMVALPLALFFFAWKTGVISNWDISDRRERPKIVWTLVCIELVSALLLHASNMIPILVIFIVFALITHFWKMSGHSMCAAIATGVTIHLFGWLWCPVLLIVPLVGWARVIRHDHTIWQVAAGALYSWVLIIVGVTINFFPR